MAKAANDTTNEPDDVHVQEAVADIEQCATELLQERSVYMTKCKRIREKIASHVDTAVNRGINKKWLKKEIKKRDHERKIDDLYADLEQDEVSEFQMLSEKLGDFANTPLGAAALAKAQPDGKDTLASVGA